MKITVTNFEEMILALISICGEIDEKYLISRFGDSILKNYSYNYAKQTIRQMDVELKLINRKQYNSLETNRKYLRLSKRKGYEALEKISKELMPHFELMAGDSNNRYKGSANRLMRKRDTMFLALTHLLDGIMVDYLWIDSSPKAENEIEPEYRKSVFDKKGELLHPREIIARMESGEVCYLTSGALKDIHNQAASIFKGNTKYTGLLLAPPVCFICYYIPYPDYSWSNTEEQLKLLVKTYITNLLGEGKAKAPAAIFYLYDEKCYYEFINGINEEKNKANRGRRLNPADIYESGFLLPLCNNYREIREILLMENGEEKLSKVILGENYTAGTEHDGIVRGCKVYNLLLSDFVKMQRIREKVRAEDSILVIHKWQERTLRKYFGEQTRIITIGENDFSDYLMEIYEMC